MAVSDQDYYQALGLPRDASEDEIRRAYRRLARQYHPDVNREPGAEDRFKEISEAYDVLRDPEKRERYDRLGANWRAAPDMSGFEESYRAGGGFDPFRAGGGFDDVGIDFGSDDFGGLFEGFFGRSRTRGGRTGFDGFSSRGGDAEADLELSLEEAARGGRRRISLQDGRSLEVEIPAGVRDGQRIRLAGEGLPGVGGSQAGDLFLRVRLRPHPHFRVEGRDLLVDLPVSPWEAALGAEVPVPTLAGSARVKVPAGSSCGRRLRLRGQGLPDPGGGTPGNLYATVSIRVPRRLTRRERELFQELASESSFNPRERR